MHVGWSAERRADAAFDGCIINISSVSAEVASVNRGDYCMARAGTSMATKLWAVRLAEFGIRVYEIRPGIIATDMTAGVKEKYDKLIAEGLTLEPRWGNAGGHRPGRRGAGARRISVRDGAGGDAGRRDE